MLLPCLTGHQTMVEVVKITATSFTRSYACTAAIRAPDPAAGHHWPHLSQRLLDTHRRVWVSTQPDLTQVWLSLCGVSGSWSNNREGTEPCPSTENWIKDLMNMAPPFHTRPSFPHSQSPSPGSFYKPLILILWGQTEWKPQSQKTNRTDHMDHSPNSMKL